MQPMMVLRDINTGFVWEKRFNLNDPNAALNDPNAALNEMLEFESKCAEERKTRCGMLGLFTRTNNFKNFAKDFFLPICTQSILKIKNVVCKIFVALLTIPFDIALLPIRLLLLPWRYYDNKKAFETNPIRRALIAYEAPRQILQSNGLLIQFCKWQQAGRSTVTNELFYVQDWSVRFVDLNQQVWGNCAGHKWHHSSGFLNQLTDEQVNSIIANLG